MTLDHASVRPSTADTISSLIPVVARSHRALAATHLRHLGLYPGQELLLMLLWESEPRLQSELARTLDIEPPTATKTLTRMEASGLLKRQRSGSDGRQVEVHLTAAGRAMRHPVTAFWQDLERETTTRLTGPEQQELMRLLRLILAGVTAARDLVTSDPA